MDNQLEKSIAKWLEEYEQTNAKLDKLLKGRTQVILKLHADGKSVAEIARLFKMKHPNVSAIIKKSKEELTNQFL